MDALRPSRVSDTTSEIKNDFSESTSTAGTPEHVPESSELPLNLYRESKLDPYLCEVLELGEAYGHFEMPFKVDFIDSYILSKTNEREEYKNMFDEFVKKSKASSESVYILIDKVFDFVRIQKKLEDILAEKEAFEMKDPLEMNAKELKKWITSGGR